MAIREIAEAVKGLNWSSVSPEIQRRATMALRDALGAGVGAARAQSASIAAEQARAEPGVVPLLLGGHASPTLAAMANGVAVSALDFDDGHHAGEIHPTGVVLAALISAIHVSKASTQDLLACQLAGGEVALRIAELTRSDQPRHRQRCTGGAGAVGAAAAVAKLIGLDGDGIERAMRIAAAHAPIAPLELPMVKESIGWGAATGFASAMLASRGFHHGEARIPGMGDHPLDRDAAADVAGEIARRELLMSTTYFKRFACCRYTHTAAAALTDLVAAHDVDPGDVDTVVVYTHAGAQFLSDQAPTTLEGAQYSFPFVLASILVRGAAGPDEINVDALGNPETISVAMRTVVTHDPDLDDMFPACYPARVELRSTAGDVLEQSQSRAPGDPELPLDDDELRSKFVALVGPVAGTNVAERWADALDRPDKADLGAVLRWLGEIGPAKART